MRQVAWVMAGWLACVSGAVPGQAANQPPRPNPPEITWDWYKAGETYLRYKVPNPKLSTRYFRKAAERGNVSAQYKLGEHYENGVGVPKDYREAYRWYRRAGEAGDRYAEFKVGWFLQKGMGVRQSSREAARWYQRAADGGNPWGYHMLGFMLADGEGVRRDPAKARRYLEISVRETNDSWAKWKLAELVKTREPERARSLYSEAAAQGNTEARRILSAMR